MADYYSETPIKAARKQHYCHECGKPIEIGKPYLRCSGSSDGGFWTGKFHAECRAAVDDYNHKNRSNWDDWYSLDEMDAEDWPWLLEKHPVVAARFGVTQARIDKSIAERKACYEHAITNL